jgi:serine/threonine-protein kinase PknG
LARIAAQQGQRDVALAALEKIPATSRAYGDARRTRAVLLMGDLDPADALADLSAASRELDHAAVQPAERTELRIRILRTALDVVREGGTPRGAVVGNVDADEMSLRVAIERELRDAARLTDDPAQRVQLVDEANSIRPRTLT